MPGKLRWAIGAIKDRTSIGIARVSSSSSALDVAVLKATSHDEVPIDERHVTEVLLLVAASPLAATACVQAVSRRMARTHNWVVALKCLMLIYYALHDGGAHFAHAVFAAATACRDPGGRGRRRRLLDLSAFRDESKASRPWDYTAFVRTFALYLDACLESALLRKLPNLHGHPRRRSYAGNRIAYMKPPMVLDRITQWQHMLERAIATRPTGDARTSRIVQISLYVVVRESFDLYRDISTGLSLLLDNFFHLQHALRIETFQACVKAVNQFEELKSFYALCKKLGIGRASDYPAIQMISRDRLQALEEFLKNPQNSSSKALPNSSRPERILSTGGETSDLESLAGERNCTPEARVRASSVSSSSSSSRVLLDLISFDHQQKASTASSSVDWENGMVSDIVPFDNQSKASDASNLDGWELMLIETASEISSQGSSVTSMEGITRHVELKSSPSQSWSYQFSNNYRNPFINDSSDKSLAVVAPSPRWSSAPSPTFRADRPNEEAASKETSLFPLSRTPGTAAMQQLLVHEQERWMQHQRKILARNRERW